MLDINIEQLYQELKDFVEALATVDNRFKNNLRAYQACKKEHDLISSQLTWRERYFFGLFGGQRSKAKRLKLLQVNTRKLRKVLN